MDYSPYRSRSGYSSRRGNGSKGTLWVFVISAFVGFLLFWGIKSFFFRESGTVVLPTLHQNSSLVQVMLEGLDSWSSLRPSEEARVVAEGDKIRTKKGSDAVLELENGTSVFLGLGSEIQVNSLRKNTDQEVYGNISVLSAPEIFSFNGAFDLSEQLKIWVDDTVYIRGEKGKILVTNTSVDMLAGDKITAFLTDSDGKITSTKEFGIGQSLDISSFSVQAIPEKSKYIPLYQLYIAPPSTVNDDEQPTNADIEIIAPPKIIEPGLEDEVMEITTVPQTLSGTAPEEAEKIIVEFENAKGELDPYVLKNFKGEDKTWKYIASPSYETISEGKNIYRVYAITAAGEKSKPATIILEYTPNKTEQNIFTNSKGVLSITSPNGGGDTTQSKTSIQLKGTAPSNASYITVINSTLGSSYTLTKFRKGNKTWWYQTGAMDPGTYKYIVKAQAANRKTLSADTITITVSDPRGSTPTPKANIASSAEVKRTPTPKPTPTPVVSTDEVAR